ncbi:MAG TPA: toll/interleukin-1 receptor domain-containing protein, partial [Myxococcus sp.]|nr:toll/interleukin-1 receptor domain-containing protein [Myxococcus sp.]
MRRLADGLRRAGYQPWLIEDELGMGGALPEVIERGLRDSAFVVGCLSHEAVSRGWLQGELRLIIERLPQEGGPRLLLVRFEEVAVPEALQKWSCLDIFDARWDDGVAQLVGFLGADAGGPGDDARLFQALASVSPGALRVMLAAAVFAPGPIPTDWLVATAGLQHDEPEARTLLDELASVELLQAANEGRGVTPAPLAVGRLRAGLAPEMAEKLRVAALAAMASRVTLHQSQSSDEKTKDAEARLFQAESLLRTTSASLELFLWCGLALLIGTRMLRHQRVQPGRELLEEALALAEASEPGQGLQPVALGCLLSLARLARVQDESAHAKQFLDRAGRIAWALPEDARAGALSDVLVELTHLERDPVAAAQAAQRALDLIQQSPSASPELKAHRMLVLAICTRDLGVMDTARSLLEQALKLLEEAGLAETPEAARVYAGLASVLLQSGDTAQAGTLLERALSIEQRTLRDSNPRMAIRLSSLAEVRLAEGRLAEAKALFTQARDMMESRYGPNYKDLGSTLHNLGLTLRRLGEVEEARAAYERAIR